MSRLEVLMAQYPKILFSFCPLPLHLSGLDIGHEIMLNSRRSQEQQYQWLLEEVGHIETSVGDISDYGFINSMKQERQARRWGYTHYFTRSDMDRLRREYANEESDYPAAEDLGIDLPYLHEVGLAYGLQYKHVLD